MMMEMEVMHSGQQDMDLIDILWKQDIDLGARREVFDSQHRQKEHELRRQRQLEEEKQEQLLREQEEALLAQLQLDEETGEYIPRPPPPPSTGAASAIAASPLEATQDGVFAQDDHDAMSFDDCLLLLAETFPVDAAESAPACLDAPAAAATAASIASIIMASPEPPALSPAAFPPAPLPVAPPPPQRMSVDLEEAWMELWSLPELQQSLNMQLDDRLDALDASPCPLPNGAAVQSAAFPFYAANGLPGDKTNSLGVAPAAFMGAFDGCVPAAIGAAAPADELVHMKPEAPPPPLGAGFGAESFCDVFYSNAVAEDGGGRPEFDGNDGAAASVASPFTPADLYSLSPGDALDRGQLAGLAGAGAADVPDSDSGISSHASPTASSPHKSLYGGGGGSLGFGDSDADEPYPDPGSAESDYSDMFSINFQPDGLDAAISLSAPGGPPPPPQEGHGGQAELAEDGGHDDAPFAKDKQRRRRADARLSRDEQRAKALRIPFTVDAITNLPVDDFNEMMSKQQLSEAQLALVRDIRRRGKNKVAAQNCRKRKMENIAGLEHDLDALRERRDRLLADKGRHAARLKESKRQLSALYLQVFGLLRDPHGRAYSPAEYSLQQSSDGSIFLVPRVKKTDKREDAR